MIFILSFFSSFSQSRSSKRTFEFFDISDGNGILDSLITGGPIFLVGFLIAYSVWWSKTDKEKRDLTNSQNNWGCFGVILIFIGLFFLLPLIALLEFLFVSIWSIIWGIIIIGAIIIGINSLINKK
ncbi:hypothetical protein [Gelidibacter sp. F63206]|uniref:hypothetical protein n=1 Tax=Gelidibacter sp. F63206 TaxID=2926425 RepID=UPI001FF13DB9|nr:hypothetical protein [Gelidibacter sp. F63206]MCK0114660.1 hypothetical protein [Gelidibacter sp. F63206]